MNIEVLLFARLRELVGHDRVVVRREELLTVRDVWDGLRAQYPQVEGFGKSLLVSVNQEFADWSTAVNEGDELAFFPPVSGGSEGGDPIRIIRSPILIEPMVSQLRQPEDGAVVVFDGIVRNHSQGRKTLYLEYEGYEPMALKKMREIEEAARKPMACESNRHCPSVGTARNRRSQRRHRRYFGPPQSSFRSLPVHHRYLEKDGSYLEKGVLRRW